MRHRGYVFVFVCCLVCPRARLVKKLWMNFREILGVYALGQGTVDYLRQQKHKGGLIWGLL